MAKNADSDTIRLLGQPIKKVKEKWCELMLMDMMEEFGCSVTKKLSCDW